MKKPRLKGAAHRPLITAKTAAGLAKVIQRVNAADALADPEIASAVHYMARVIAWAADPVTLARKRAALDKAAAWRARCAEYKATH